MTMGFSTEFTVGFSEFARNRHNPQSGKAYYKGDSARLYTLICENWGKRKPGFGHKNTERCVVIPLPPDDFHAPGRTVLVTNDMTLHASLGKREGAVVDEESFIKVKATGVRRVVFEGSKPPHHIPYAYIDSSTGVDRYMMIDRPTVLPTHHVEIVLYSAAAIRENDGTPSGDFDWEIVSINVCCAEDEPVDPVTMTRNYLERPGGTKVEYTAEDFARSIDYWKDKCILADQTGLNFVFSNVPDRR